MSNPDIFGLEAYTIAYPGDGDSGYFMSSAGSRLSATISAMALSPGRRAYIVDESGLVATYENGREWKPSNG